MRTVSCAATALALSPFTRAVFVTRCAVANTPPRTLARLAVLLTVTRVFPARTRSRTWARLLAAFGSVLVDATVATLVRLPVRIGRTRSRIAARPPGAMSWSRHEIAGFRVHVPSLVRIDSTSARPVIASVTWTPVAVAGPAFDTVI